MKKITIPINSNYKYLQFWNGIFNMTPKELNILSLFLECANDYEDLCNLDNKKCVALALGFRDKNTLNNYIKKLKDKNVFIVKKNCYTLNKFLNPNNGNVQVSISWR